MDLPDVAGLVLLALLDSTSVGTLLLPVWMLLGPGPAPVRRVLVHLGVVAGGYAGVGAVLLTVGTGVLGVVGDGTGTALSWAQLVLGLVLFGVSFAVDSGRRRRAGPDRTARWRERVTDASDTQVVALAGGAVAIEVATMLPYLAALGIVGAAGLPAAQAGTVLVGYCLVMIAPALLLLTVRTLAAGRVEQLLRRVEAWATRQGDAALGWLMGIAGFLLARDAVGRLGGLDAVLAVLGVR